MISVIIPVYNAAEFLEKAVTSAIEQDEVSQILLIEDGSTDDSFTICTKLVKMHPKIVNLITHKDRINKGAGASRNLGLEQADSEFVAFLDADDFYLPNRFSHDIGILKSNYSIDGVYNALGTHIYDASKSNRVAQQLTTVTHHIIPESLFEEMAPIGSSGYFSGDALTVRKSIFEKVGYFETTLELSQDTHMWIKMAAKTRLVAGIIDKPVAVRGVHSSNRIADQEKFMYYRPLLFISLLRWSDENGITEQRRLRLWENALRHYWNYLRGKGVSKLITKARVVKFALENTLKSPYLIKYLHYLSLYLKR